VAEMQLTSQNPLQFKGETNEIRLETTTRRMGF